MAQTTVQGYAQSQSPGKLAETRAKVIALSNEISKFPDLSTFKSYFEWLCPSIEEKVMFVAVYNKIYPNQLGILKCLSEWLDQAFANYCNNNIIQKEVDKMAQLYRTAYEDQNSYTYRDVKHTPAWENKPYQKYADPYNYVSVKPAETEPAKRSFISKMFGKFSDKKPEVSHVTSEEINEAKPAKRPTYSPEEVQAQIRLERYNNKVRERAQKIYSQPVFEKEEVAMHR